RHDVDESGGGEPPERFAHRRAAHAEVRRERLDGQRISRLVLEHGDRAKDCVVRGGGEELRADFLAAPAPCGSRRGVTVALLRGATRNGAVAGAGLQGRGRHRGRGLWDERPYVKLYTVANTEVRTRTLSRPLAVSGSPVRP